jgi:tetratricopeptide (TPR) repeat protein
MKNLTIKEWIQKGIDSKKHGKFKKAVKCFQKAIEINPNNIEAWMIKGITHEELHEFSHAIVCFDEVIKLDPFSSYAIKRREIIGGKLLENLQKSSLQGSEINPLGKSEPPPLLKSDILRFGEVPIFGWLGLLSIIGALASLIQFFILLFIESEFSWILLISASISLISAIAWLTLYNKFKQIADVATRLLEKIED